MEAYFLDKKIMITGGAGFVGSHLVDRLIEYGAKVYVVDNLVTGRFENIAHHEGQEQFHFIEADVSKPTDSYMTEAVEMIYHLASPASPADFEAIPVEIYSVNSFGTHYLCEYANTVGSRLLFASTSEAYGEPLEHPQREEYRGNVSTTGVRAPYDESKRLGETIVSTFARKYGLDTRIVRIFNTYGPRMLADDGRVIPTFIYQALKGESLTVHGNGSQTRSYCYVSDLVEYLLQLMVNEAARSEVVNIGNPEEYTVRQTAEMIIRLTGSQSEIIEVERPKDDPSRRQPNIEKAVRLTGFEPGVGVEEGLLKTIEHFRS
jgi:dTDP-glucose 4,6-dehydratase